jgi:hypothetical protein
VIETLDDIIEHLADQLGVYGAHPEADPGGVCRCRCCWTSNLRDHIERAVDVERRLARTVSGNLEIEHKAAV